MKILQEAGLPDGVINFIPGDPGPITDILVAHRDLAGVHFTGSTTVFHTLWKTVGERIASYRSYPRLVGETGARTSSWPTPAPTWTRSPPPSCAAASSTRGRSAAPPRASSCRTPSGRRCASGPWRCCRRIRVGDVRDFRNFMGAVIDRKAFDKITGYIEHAKESKGIEIIHGGTSDDSKGYFIDPTLVQVEDSAYRLMCEEVFGPVLALHVYPERDWERIMDVVDAGTPYALTGAVFSNERKPIVEADRRLRNSAGNFYINDKPTGAVVGQQPFGGGRASGTNDKAGSVLNMVRWISPRAIKETLAPAQSFEYPFMEAE
jgi:1-pyrroline-5-carboxylate dehydrogenase